MKFEVGHRYIGWLETRFPELARYWNDDHTSSISWPDAEEGTYEQMAREVHGMGNYRIVFEAGGERFYCNVEAMTVWEALGLFFREHPHVTYDMVVDHVEV